MRFLATCVWGAFLCSCSDPGTLGASQMERRELGMIDYGRTGESVAPYYVVRPASAAELSVVVVEAHRLKKKLRIRGRGHSMNQSSLPRKGEISLDTSGLNYYEFDSPGTVRVGAGVPMTDIDELVRGYGMSLPVLNDGGRGPSLGGYVAAGGIGRGATVHGGFWANVLQLVVVSGSGEILVIDRTDPLFPWFFGSMGRLGVVAEARLQLVAENQVTQPYPVGASGRIDVRSASARVDADENLFWLTVFAPVVDRKRLRERLESLMARHSESANFTEIYEYRIASADVVAPLVYPEPGEFAAMGVWGSVRPGGERFRKLFALSDAIDHLLREEPGWRRYVQTEAVRPSFDHLEYFGPRVGPVFALLESSLDPHQVLNPRN